MREKNFWSRKRVFLTGHTGFKGSWLAIWLHSLGAEVTGYALAPPTQPSLFELARVDRILHSVIADICDLGRLTKRMRQTCPEIVIHMAAQPIVRDSYKSPAETYATNVMGTVHLFEAIRKCPGIKAVVNVTTDKCYENREWLWGYRENEPLGGFDPYSSSKACSEFVTASYRSSFFNPQVYSTHGVAIASARSGNVIGGGDWAKDRLVPDCLRALLNGRQIFIRNPQALRPWQHVLDPLWGYLLLAQKLYEEGPRYAEAWNFGPRDQDAKSVEWIVQNICRLWGPKVSYVVDRRKHPHEAHCLKLDSSKAKSELQWVPRWNLEQAVDKVMEWVQAYREGRDIRKVCGNQIEEYEKMVDSV